MSSSIGSFETNLVERAYLYWESKAARRIPSRHDLLPEEMTALLPHVFLIDVEPAPLGFRFRLVGSEIGRWAQREYSGVRINELEYGPAWRSVFDAYARVVSSRKAEVARYRAPWVGREFLRYERLIAPLSSDGDRVDMLFGALYPIPSPRADAVESGEN